MGRGVPLSSRLEGLGERRELLQKDEMKMLYCHEKICIVNHEFVQK